MSIEPAESLDSSGAGTIIVDDGISVMYATAWRSASCI